MLLGCRMHRCWLLLTWATLGSLRDATTPYPPAATLWHQSVHAATPTMPRTLTVKTLHGLSLLGLLGSGRKSCRAMAFRMTPADMTHPCHPLSSQTWKPMACHAALCFCLASRSSSRQAPALGLFQARVRILSPGSSVFKGLTSSSQKTSESRFLERHSVSHGWTSQSEWWARATTHALLVPSPFLSTQSAPCVAGGSSYDHRPCFSWEYISFWLNQTF